MRLPDQLGDGLGIESGQLVGQDRRSVVNPAPDAAPERVATAASSRAIRPTRPEPPVLPPARPGPRSPASSGPSSPSGLRVPSGNSVTMPPALSRRERLLHARGADSLALDRKPADRADEHSEHRYEQGRSRHVVERPVAAESPQKRRPESSRDCRREARPRRQGYDPGPSLASASRPEAKLAQTHCTNRYQIKLPARTVAARRRSSVWRSLTRAASSRHDGWRSPTRPGASARSIF